MNLKIINILYLPYFPFSSSSLEYSSHIFPKCSATLCLSCIVPDAISSPASTAKLLSLDVNGEHFSDWSNKNMNARMTVLD